MPAAVPAVTAAKPSVAAVQARPAVPAAGPRQGLLPDMPGPVLEEPGHPFEEFLAKKFDELVLAMTMEGARLRVSPVTQLKVLVNMLTVRVAAFAVRGSIAREDILRVLDHFWRLQPKPPQPKPPPLPPVAK